MIKKYLKKVDISRQKTENFWWFNSNVNSNVLVE